MIEPNGVEDLMRRGFASSFESHTNQAPKDCEHTVDGRNPAPVDMVNIP